MIKRILFILLAIISFQPIMAQKEYNAPENKEFRIVGYVPGYRTVSQIPDNTLQKLNIACYAFATINPMGKPVVNDEKQLKKFVHRAHRLGVKVMICFSGKHVSFTQTLADEKKRNAFVEDLWHIVKKYKLDGIDNDWEFPRTTDGTDKLNLQLMKQLAEKCRSGKKRYYLTMAVTSGMFPGNRASAIMDETIALVDWLNVMVYGNFSETKPGQHHSTYDMLEKSYNYWVTQRGIDPRKFVMGLPVYGLASGLPKKTSSASYSSIIKQNGEKATLTDSIKVVNQIHTTPYTVYYNGLPTIRKKVNFAINKGLGGIMFWEVSQDMHNDISIIKAACDEAAKK